jgi:hypothetical protein
MAYQRKCPRCEKNLIPNNESPGEYPGAMSRVTVDDRRIIEICSQCGVDESLEEFFGGALTPVGQWPITDWLDATKDLAKAIPKDVTDALQEMEGF